MKQLVLAARLVFGAAMLAIGANHFLGPFLPLPSGTAPLAVQLMDALVHTGLLDVAMAIALVCGALLLAGIAVPAALCMLMPISVCAAYWAVILEQEPMRAALVLAGLVLNGLLMLAYLDYYRGVLERHPQAAGEA